MVVEGIETGTDDPIDERRRQDELYDLVRKHGVPTHNEISEKIQKLLEEKSSLNPKP